MKIWTIKKRIITGFTIIAALIALLGALGWNSIRVIGEHANDLVVEEVPGMAHSADLLLNLAEAHLAFVLSMLATNAEDKRADAARLQALDQTNALAGTETGKRCSSPDQKQAFEKFKQAQRAYLTVRKSILQLSEAGNNAEALAQLQQSGRTAYEACNAAGMDLNDLAAKNCADAAGTVQHQIQASKELLVITGLVELAFGMLLSFLIVTGLGKVLRTVSSSLTDGANQVASASCQVASASQTLAEGASEQASSLEETSSSLEELTAMTKRNAENARQANELARDARAAADQGGAYMQTMNAAMEAIKVSSDDTAKIIKTIDEIAFQTNILALNAAVEAARAGEAGMGFAVVADEVRNLAQRSAQAARETAAKIEGAIRKTEQGVGISQKVSAALNDIVAKTRQVDQLATEVASASQEQTLGIVQINAAVSQMDRVTQSNAATAEESASASEELSSQAEVMKQSVAALLQLVTGRDESATNHPAVHAHNPRATRENAGGAKRFPPATYNSGHGNGHEPVAPARVTTARSRGEIPMDGDFQDF